MLLQLANSSAQPDVLRVGVSDLCGAIASKSVSYVCEALLFQVDLLSRRCAARAAKDYRTADALRDMLVARFGVDLNDRDNTWRGGGRVGTQDGPDFFEDRPARLHRVVPDAYLPRFSHTDARAHTHIH